MSRFDDFVVHEAAHIFHNCKHRTIGLREIRECEWLLEIDFVKRETFAYACEAYSRILNLGDGLPRRRTLLSEIEKAPRPADERVDTSEYMEILREAVAARNGWKRILKRGTPPRPARRVGLGAVKHFVSATRSCTPMNDTQDLKVFISARESSCGECGETLGRSAWITLAGKQGALCLTCADLDHLIFVESGNAALTRRARNYSTLSAIVLKWSRARNRYERQGILVEESALARAEAECLADDDARAGRREREAGRRAELDREYVERFAQRVREMFPNCPASTEHEVAEHACLRYSGRVGRSFRAKAFDEEAVRLAVVAHIRHVQTPYDDLLAKGQDRHDARRFVTEQVRSVLDSWRRS